MGLERRVNAERQTEFLGYGKHAVMVGVAVGLAAPDIRSHKKAFHPVPGRPAQLCFGQLGDADGDMGNRQQASVRIRAKVHQPAIIRPGIGHRQFKVLAFGFPQQAQRGVEKHLLDMLDVQALQPLLGVHGTKRGIVHIAGPGRLALILNPPKLVHHPQPRGRALARHFGGLTVDLKIFQAVGVLPNTDRAVAVLGFQIFFPQVGRFEYMTVGIDHA